jgi:hypothetical protein
MAVMKTHVALNVTNIEKSVTLVLRVLVTSASVGEKGENKFSAVIGKTCPRTCPPTQPYISITSSGGLKERSTNCCTFLARRNGMTLICNY